MKIDLHLHLCYPLLSHFFFFPEMQFADTLLLSSVSSTGTVFCAQCSYCTQIFRVCLDQGCIVQTLLQPPTSHQFRELCITAFWPARNGLSHCLVPDLHFYHLAPSNFHRLYLSTAPATLPLCNMEEQEPNPGPKMSGVLRQHRKQNCLAMNLNDCVFVKGSQMSNPQRTHTI